MPTKKKRKSRSRSYSSKEKYTAELSSSQLIIGVCILMLFGLTCFLLGLLAGRFDTTPGAAVATPPTQSDTPEVIARRNPPQRVASESPDRRRMSAPPAPVVAPEPRAEETQPAKPAPEEAVEPVPVANTPDPQPKPAATTKEMPAPKPASTALTENPAPDPARSATTATPQKAVIAPQSQTGEYFSVQIGAYSDKKNARTIIDNIEGKSAYTAQLIDSPSGRLVIVLVGRFSDRPEAEKARAFLRDSLGFKDCFVKRKSS